MKAKAVPLMNIYGPANEYLVLITSTNSKGRAKAKR